MLRYALGRIGQMVPIALLVTVLVFFLIKLIPGDPASDIGLLHRPAFVMCGGAVVRAPAAA